MSNILDKPLESVFGFISVLPGAFSAYRWEAIKGKPLEQYFHGEFPTTDIKSANLYLAEDRILCFEVVAKERCNWILKYVKDAKAETDSPDNLPELISQRRRWLNGSFFCSLHSIANFGQFFKTSHSKKQLFALTIQTLYNCVNILLVWFAVANFYITFYALFDTRRGIDKTGNQDLKGIDPFYPVGGIVLGVLQVLYFVALIGCLVASMGNRPRGTKKLYVGIAVFFAILMLLMLFMGFWAIGNHKITF
jgi:chitin synthase